MKQKIIAIAILVLIAIAGYIAFCRTPSGPKELNSWSSGNDVQVNKDIEVNANESWKAKGDYKYFELKGQAFLEKDAEALLEYHGFAVHQAPKIKLDTEVIEKISYAMLAEKYITFRYKNKKGEEKLRKVAPYAIIYSEYTYLVAKGDEDTFCKHFLLYKILPVA